MNIFNNSSIFDVGIKEIPEDCEVVFVSDFFVGDLQHNGGAELTSEALIKSSPYKVFKLHSKDVSIKNLESGQNKFWIFGNFAAMDLRLIPAIIQNMKYSVLEYDQKFCKYRSPEKHMHLENLPKKDNWDCGCQNSNHGKLISAFLRGSQTIYWMSELQMELYLNLFPVLNETNNIVLSSVFDEETFSYINQLRIENKKTERKGWIVLGSDSWVKGFEQSKKYAEDNNLEYEIVWNLPYEEILNKLSKAEGLIYLANGSDTCNRLSLESLMLGCKTVVNKNSQHVVEDWCKNLYILVD